MLPFFLRGRVLGEVLLGDVYFSPPWKNTLEFFASLVPPLAGHHGRSAKKTPHHELFQPPFPLDKRRRETAIPIRIEKILAFYPDLLEGAILERSERKNLRADGDSGFPSSECFI